MNLRLIIEDLKKDTERMLFLNYFHEFKEWYRRYQRSGNQEIPPKLLELCGNNYMIDLSKKYKLYRGLYFNSSSNDNKLFDKLNQMVVSNPFKTKNMSWSHDVTTANAFARGSTHYMDHGKFKSGDIGIILVHTFSHDDILADIQYLVEKSYLSSDFEEDEVLVRPREINARILKILK